MELLNEYESAGLTKYDLSVGYGIRRWLEFFEKARVLNSRSIVIREALRAARDDRRVYIQMHGDKLTNRALGEVLGISNQRVWQIKEGRKKSVYPMRGRVSS